MDPIEHTFPLPEGEQHKLEEVEYRMKLHPAHAVGQFVKQNTWIAAGICAAAGLAYGLWLGRRTAAARGRF